MRQTKGMCATTTRKFPFTTATLAFVLVAPFLWVASDRTRVYSQPVTESPNGPHWAFTPPTRPSLPQVKDAGWAQTSVDSFVLARLEAAGISPRQPADRHALIRRLSLDLTGLPPTPEEVDAFVEDSSPNAYLTVVERLLASPRYGEHWAIWWLDAARYADSNGYEVDRTRSIWPYRDWVINALNADMPFDQFTTEQMAGDMLPEATIEQQIATGFHRNTYMNEEGGHDWEEFRYASIVDRVHTTATTFLGLTLACAQCHDHKYDPISQDEYFEFFAFLNNSDEPFLNVPNGDVRRAQKRIDAEIAGLLEALPQKFPPKEDDSGSDSASREAHLEDKFRLWHKAEFDRLTRWLIAEPVTYASQNNATMTKLDDHSLFVTGDRPELDTYNIDLHTNAGRLTGIRLEAIPDSRLPAHGPGRGSVMQDGTFALSEVTISVSPLDSTLGEERQVKIRTAQATYETKERPVGKAIDGDRLSSWHVGNGAGRKHVAVFELDPVELQGLTRVRISLLQNFIHQQTLGRFRLSLTSDAAPFVATTRSTEVDRILAQPPNECSDTERETLKAHYLTVAPELAEEYKKIRELKAKRPLLPTTLILRERETERPTHRHQRGDYRRPRELVSPGVPSILHDLPPDAPQNRLSLARWLVDERNPLVGRVIMNQLWQTYFGRGLVSTPEDFGTQGAVPTHPKLLDWLATEFVHRGWSLKTMHRLIVQSATYRQSAQAPESVRRTDPENLLLSRGGRWRLEAEAIRDGALYVSGLLDLSIGGPSVFPPQPESVSKFAFSSFTWKTSEGKDRYRRGLYTFTKRTVPYPAAQVFDAPPRNTCSVRRLRSNTPLQSLALLNDEVMVEAARALAARVLRSSAPDVEAKATYAFRLCLTRPPDTSELGELGDFYRNQLERFSSGSANPVAVTGVDKDKPPSDLNELAAWTAVSRVLLNLDEVVTRE